jgi:hypothetical protein
MAEFDFRSTEALQNKSRITDRFGDRNFISGVCTCFIDECDRFEVISDSRTLGTGGIPFPVDGSIEHLKWRHHSISGWRFRYSLCRNSPFILFRSKVIEVFHAFAMVKKYFQFLGANMTPEIFLQMSTPAKGTSLRKSASIVALWSRWLVRFGL